MVAFISGPIVITQAVKTRKSEFLAIFRRHGWFNRLPTRFNALNPPVFAEFLVHPKLLWQLKNKELLGIGARIIGKNEIAVSIERVGQQRRPIAERRLEIRARQQVVRPARHAV